MNLIWRKFAPGGNRTHNQALTTYKKGGLPFKVTTSTFKFKIINTYNMHKKYGIKELGFREFLLVTQSRVNTPCIQRDFSSNFPHKTRHGNRKRGGGRKGMGRDVGERKGGNVGEGNTGRRRGERVEGKES
jgi:hypothetical protein